MMNGVDVLSDLAYAKMQLEAASLQSTSLKEGYRALTSVLESHQVAIDQIRATIGIASQQSTTTSPTETPSWGVPPPQQL
jgi:hypothetical protein